MLIGLNNISKKLVSLKVVIFFAYCKNFVCISKMFQCITSDLFKLCVLNYRLVYADRNNESV